MNLVTAARATGSKSTSIQTTATPFYVHGTRVGFEITPI